MGPHCLSQRLLKHFSRREKQTTFDAIGALRVNSLHARKFSFLSSADIFQNEVFS